jgi:hypothetical protein
MADVASMDLFGGIEPLFFDAVFKLMRTLQGQLRFSQKPCSALESAS